MTNFERYKNKLFKLAKDRVCLFVINGRIVIDEDIRCDECDFCGESCDTEAWIRWLCEDDGESSPKKNEWVPISYRGTTEEDGIDPVKYPNYLDCPLPDHDEEILISLKNGKVDMDTFMADDGCYLDSGRDWKDVAAWMPLPEPYELTESLVNCSNCSHPVSVFYKTKFCPNCGRR